MPWCDEHVRFYPDAIRGCPECARPAREEPPFTLSHPLRDSGPESDEPDREPE